MLWGLAKKKRKTSGGAWRAFTSQAIRESGKPADWNSLAVQYRALSADEKQQFAAVGRAAAFSRPDGVVFTFGPRTRDCLRAANKRRSAMAVEAFAKEKRFRVNSMEIAVAGAPVSMEIAVAGAPVCSQWATRLSKLKQSLHFEQKVRVMYEKREESAALALFATEGPKSMALVSAVLPAVCNRRPEFVPSTGHGIARNRQ